MMENFPYINIDRAAAGSGRPIDSSAFSILFTWWAPLTTMPVSFRIYDLFFASKTIIYHEKSKFVLDLLTLVLKKS